MKQENELILKVTKEIVVKFIEMGQLSIHSFDEVFRKVHNTVTHSLKGNATAAKNEE